MHAPLPNVPALRIQEALRGRGGAARMLLRLTLAGVAALMLPAGATGQHIALKTVPIPAGDQFALFPSRNLGLGGASIALDDPLADPFINPARGGSLSGARLFVTPTFYGSDDQRSAGRSLPLSFTAGGESWFGAGAIALQQLQDQVLNRWAPVTDPSELFPDGSSDNLYAFASLGRRLPGHERVRVGASAFWADLGALDGVQRLYVRSVGIAQSGSLTEYRLGAHAGLDGGATVEGAVLRSSLDMTHRVLYADWRQDPGTFETWEETNFDRTVTWGAQVRYTRPLEAEGWRLGALLTANRKTHPKIPNYDLVNIPRDPGSSRAFQLGAGLAKVTEGSVFTVEAVLEPARSHTWAYADTAVATPSGDTIAPGGRTVDNRFEFRNVILGAGIQRESDKAGFQLGMRVRSIRYELDQENYLQDRERHTRESWLEWTPTWSAALKFPDWELRYSGRSTMKGWTGGGCFFGCAVEDVAVAPGGNDFLVAPTDPVNMPDFRVTTHQLTVTVPIG